MFGKKKLDTPLAKKLIEDAIQDTENKSDRAYADGLIEMAYELGAITMNERAAYKTTLYTKKV